MKKILFVMVMLCGFGLASCDKTTEKESGNELVEVILNAKQEISKASSSRTLVTANGVTRWAVGDEVVIIDSDKDKTPRTFQYVGTSASAAGKFKGMLIKSNDPFTYYAYYNAEAIDCELSESVILNIGYEDLEITDPTAAKMGKHCPMVAIPATFKTANPENTGLEFHHVPSLIEASISCPEDNPLRELEFDKVVLELNVAEQSPDKFNSRIKLNLEKIVGGPEKDVDIVYQETGEKIDKLTSTLNYTAKMKLDEMIDDSGVDCFSIPIFALPMSQTVQCEGTVTFYNDDEVVATMFRRVKFTGLKPSGLNVMNLDDSNLVTE